MAGSGGPPGEGPPGPVRSATRPPDAVKPPMNTLVEQLRAEIRRSGPIPFATFMERALYDPAHGYYARCQNQTGRRGDFYTSVSVGPLFGALLAFQFARWREAGPTPSAPFHIVEAGAHDGQLACDVLTALQAAEPALFSAAEYWIVEPSSQRRTAQQKTLAGFPSVRWWESWQEIRGRVHGVIFSNELLDAMPVHPFAWNPAQRLWEELGVTVAGDSFASIRISTPITPPPQLPEALLDVLPDGYIIESSPAAALWWRDAADALAQGRLMTIDYGGTFEELLSPGRTTGTLRAYARHRVSAEVLANPGAQDITAHVNFTEIQEAGEVSGLKTETFTSQGQFLTRIARELWQRPGTRPQEQARQFQTLTHPEHLGRPFRVLVQAR